MNTYICMYYILDSPETIAIGTKISTEISIISACDTRSFEYYSTLDLLEWADICRAAVSVFHGTRSIETYTKSM